MGDVINLRDAFTESERVTHTLPINKDWEAFIPKTKLLQITAELILGVKKVRDRCEEDLHEHMGLYYLGEDDRPSSTQVGVLAFADIARMYVLTEFFKTSTDMMEEPDFRDFVLSDSKLSRIYELLVEYLNDADC